MAENHISSSSADLQAVDELSTAYARILESVWSMPAFSRQRSEYALLQSDVDTPGVNKLGWPGLLLWPLRLPFRPIRGWWRSFLVRPVVSLYVNTHVSSSAARLSGVLTRERLVIAETNDPRAETLDHSLAALERLKSVTTGWIVLLVLLRFVPLVGLLFSMGIVTLGLSLKDAPGLLLESISALPILVLLIHPVIVQFGFRWKRALFAGGGIDAAGMPRANVYEIEQRTYRQLGVRRSTEFPVDLFLAPGFYFLLNWMVGVFTESVSFTDETTATWQLVLGYAFLVAFVLFLVMSTARLVLRYKHRRASGNY